MICFFRTLFIGFLIFAIISLACISGRDGDGWRAVQKTQTAEQANIDATSTFGSEQFHIQQTAMWEGTQIP